MNRSVLRALPLRQLGVLVALASLVTLSYSNTFFSAFQFDDWLNIADNSEIRKLSRALMNISESRYVGYSSFAINYSIGRLNVAGYHTTNLLIHITNGFLVYTLVSLLGRIAYQSPDRSTHVTERGWLGLDRGDMIALATALLFVTHPIQTQAVTYIVQRFTSLAAMFYLLTLICYLEFRLTPLAHRSRYVWYMAALVSTVLAMKTKENSFTLPFMLILIEGMFFRTATLRAWRPLAPFLLTLPIIPWSLSHAIEHPDMGVTHETSDISRSSYLFTQFRVIVTYVRLLILPIHQNLDYDYPLYDSFLTVPVLLSLLFLLTLGGLALYLLIYRAQYRLVGFGLAWFFLTLSVESSIVPIRDVIYEHRLYLPSVGFLLATSATALRFTGRSYFVPAVTLAVVMFSVATYQRNLVWKDEISLWKNAVLESPGKSRTHDSLGSAYSRYGQLQQATEEYAIAARLDPASPLAHNKLGNAYFRQGQFDNAITEYTTAARLAPDSAQAYNNIGSVYIRQGRFGDALREFTTAVRTEPRDHASHNNLGDAYFRQGRLDEAINEFLMAIRLKPDSPTPHVNLANAYMRQGKLAAAIEGLEDASRLNSDSAEIRDALGYVYLQAGRPKEAINAYAQLVLLTPDSAQAHNNLGNAYTVQGRFDDAVVEYLAALQLKPNAPEVHYSLGYAYLQQGRPSEARAHFQAALRVQPAFVPASQQLALLDHAAAVARP